MTHVFGTLSSVHVGSSGTHHISLSHKTSRRRRSTTTRLPRFARTTVHGATGTHRVGASSSRSHVHRPRPSRASHHSGASRVAGTRKPRPAHATKTGLSALESRRANMAKARAKEATSSRSVKQLEADLRNLLLIRSGPKKAAGVASSAATRAAALANLAKARAVSASRPRSPAQLAAARRNIVKAQAASRSRPRTAAQLAASRRNVARATAASRRRPRTAAQIAAARRNIALARLRRHHR